MRALTVLFLMLVVGSAPRADARDEATEAALRMAIARRVAPEFRFNAYVAGDDSLQNRNEDFFPVTVSRFLSSLASGRYRVVAERSAAGRPARVHTVQQQPRAVVRPEEIDGFPNEMAGDPPGKAAVYIHAVKVPGDTVHLSGSATREEWTVEYWLFYAYDWTCSRAFGGAGCLGAHRGDWEHTAYRIAAEVGPRGALRDLSIIEGYYYAHDWGVRVPRAIVKTVSDRGDAGGTHPLVYISQGKHGSYPEAGELHDFAAVWVLSDHDDFFRGNGVRVRTWEGPLVDLAPALEADGNPGPELAPPALGILAKRSGPAVPRLRTWVDYRGRWGPDRQGALGVYWTESATGPICKRSFGRPTRGAMSYEHFQRRFGAKLELYRVSGRPNPRVTPPPLPVEETQAG